MHGLVRQALSHRSQPHAGSPGAEGGWSDAIDRDVVVVDGDDADSEEVKVTETIIDSSTRSLTDIVIIT